MRAQPNTILLVGNGSYLNRGCEAIVRGTASILRQTIGAVRLINANFDSQYSAYRPDESDSDIQHCPIPKLKRWSGQWMVGQVLKRTVGAHSGGFYFHSIKAPLNRCQAALSIGGDNYSLDYGLPYRYLYLDKYIRKYNRPLIIWGASIGPFDSKPAFAQMMLSHLQQDVTAIFVRETLSKNYLAQNGITRNVFLMPDPAFLMQSEPVDINTLGFSIPSGAIGLNLSPILGRYFPANRNTWFMEAIQLLQALIDGIDRPLILIPHVTSPHSDDRQFLSDVLDQIKPIRKDIYLLPGSLNASQTKWVISKLDCLIAARTHATIAGFSCGIPTISLAYSTKAFGINQDLFGHTDWIIPSDNLSPKILLSLVHKVLGQSDAIRNHLTSQLPILHNQALQAGWILKDILEKKTADKDSSQCF